MVKRDSSKEAFTRRLIEACTSAGLEGHGRNKRIADELKKNGGKVSTPGIWKWFNAQSMPDSTNIVLLSKTLGVRAEWLEYGVGARTVGDEHVDLSQPKKEEAFRVEVLDVAASAGPGVILTSDYIEPIAAIEFTAEEAKTMFKGRTADQIKMLTVSGNSMAGTLKSGDLVFVDISARQFTDDGIYVFAFNSNLHIKRLQMMKDRLLVLSDNEHYKEWYIEDDDFDSFHIMAKVLASQVYEFKRYL